MERASIPTPLVEAKRARAKNPEALSDPELLAQYCESRASVRNYRLDAGAVRVFGFEQSTVYRPPPQISGQ